MKAKINSRIKKRNDVAFGRRFVTIGVLVSGVMVALSIFVTVYFNPASVAERKLEVMARDYYENYYYSKFIETADETKLEENFEKFSQSGFSPILLRQLLLYDNRKNAEFEKYFTKDYRCDRNKTNVVIYPVEPYGKTDYTVKLDLVCK